MRRAERKLADLAATDSLAGLANRRSLLALGQHVVVRARRSGEPIGVLLVDIDHFKQVNGRHGHDVGDRVIPQVGALLAGTCREQDIAVRWGGEEFLVLLPGATLEQTTQVAERVRMAAPGAATSGDQVEASGDPDRYTLSLGVTTVDPDEPFNERVARADRALYQSKAAGRNRVSALARPGAAV